MLSTFASIERMDTADTEDRIYHLAIGTYLIANAHFFSEMLIYRTVKLNRASASVFGFASKSTYLHPPNLN